MFSDVIPDMPSPLVVTMGDPAGIGPDVILKALQNPQSNPWVVIGDPDVFEKRAQLLSLPLEMEIYQGQRFKPKPHVLQLIHHPLKHSVEAGKPNLNTAGYLLETLEMAIDGCQTKHFHALVTGPLNKALIQEAGYPFMGHTEFLAQKTQSAHIVMLLASETLRVALATTHIPLSQVAHAISEETLKKTLLTLHNGLVNAFQIPHPSILVCGLNPHAGEGGYLGKEDIQIIQPAIDYCQSLGMAVSGPYSADTLFLKKADAILSMYHDQGLPVIKTLHFNEIANITLGLPFIRTSVDHGTAYALAGTPAVQEGSFCYALKVARKLSQSSYHVS